MPEVLAESYPSLFQIHEEFDMSPAKDFHNEFGVPLLTMEIISRHSRETDLFYKPYFYETIGVEEYFVGEASIEHGKIVKAYRLVKGRYQPITVKGKQYYSTVLGTFLPRVLAL